MPYDFEDGFNQKLKEILGTNLPKKIIIAVSGGIDSMALLSLSNQFCQKNNIDLIAITVDHKTREDSAMEAKFVTKICQKHKVQHQILENNFVTPTSNIESSLREIRYKLLLDFAKEQGIKNILIAHHQQDVAENFLIRLFRGSGIDGLSSIEEFITFKNTNFIRPLLDFTKDQLQKYLQINNITHIEDPSNQDQKFLRNKIRTFLNSFEDKEVINQRISRASKNILENRKIIENLVKEKSREIYKFNDLGYFVLKKKNFKNLNKELSFRYLNLIINYFNGKFYKSRLKKIEALYGWLLFDQDHKAKNFNGAIIENFDEESFIIYREKSKIDLQKITEHSFIWDNRFQVNINKNLNLKNLKITALDAKELNILLKGKKNLKYKNLKIPLKKVFYTIPIIRKGDNIFAIYCLKNSSEVEIEMIDSNLYL